MSTNSSCNDNHELDMSSNSIVEDQEDINLLHTPVCSEKADSIEECLEGITRLMRPEFQAIIVANSPEITHLRSTISSEEEAESFLEAFSSVTSTHWISYHGIRSPQRLVFHKKWICHHSNKRKTKNSKRNFDCESYVDVKIKKNNRSTRRNDLYLRLSPPLQAVIKLKFNHSHPTNTKIALSSLRIKEEVKNKFLEYFENGMSAREARKFYTSQTFIGTESLEVLDNAAINPGARQVWTLYDNWRLQKGFRSAEIENVLNKDSSGSINKSIKYPVALESECRNEASTSRMNLNTPLDEERVPMTTNAEKFDFIVEIERLVNLCQGEIPRNDLLQLLGTMKKIETKSDFFMAMRTASCSISEMFLKNHIKSENSISSLE